jgi:nicotinamidase-related amidase
MFPKQGGEAVEANKTAVVLIEFQNDFCKEGGVLHDGVKDEMARQGTIANAVKLAEGARAKGALVIHAPFIFSQQKFDQFSPVGIVKAVADGGAFRAGEWGAEHIDELKPQGGDKVVSGKDALCGFNGTDLDEILKDGQVKNLAVAGFLTNFCVESTTRTAYDKGYGVTVISDATAATSQEEQSHSEEKIFPALGGSMSVDEFLGQLD